MSLIANALEKIEEEKFKMPTQQMIKTLEIRERKHEIEIEPFILKILKGTEMFKKINKEFDKRIVGEEKARTTIFLCACGKQVINHENSSYNLMVNSESGAGKDYVVTQVMKIFPNGDCVSRKGISPKIFRYWHNAKYEPDWNWNGKVFYGEDLPNAVLNDDTFKIMCSSGNMKSTVVYDQKPIEIVVRGKPVVIITTARASPGKEQLRRFTILELDETEDQTKAIMKKQAKYAALGLTTDYDKDIKAALEKLRRVRVKIAFAEKLAPLFPSENIIMRTAFPRFLDYIKASCALHQYQREIDNDGYYIAIGQDYNIARTAIMKTTSNQYMIPLTKDQKKIIEVFEKLDKITHSVSELEEHITFMSDKWLRMQLNKLADFGMIKKSREYRDDSKKNVAVFNYIESIELKIPKWENIKNIKGVLNRL